MLTAHEIESIRRSHAMAPLAPGQVIELIDACDELARRQRAMAEVLAAVPGAVGDLRAALNELHRLVNGP